jgi:hypothetical protein
MLLETISIIILVSVMHGFIPWRYPLRHFRVAGDDTEPGNNENSGDAS